MGDAGVGAEGWDGGVKEGDGAEGCGWECVEVFTVRVPVSRGSEGEE